MSHFRRLIPISTLLIFSATFVYAEPAVNNPVMITWLFPITGDNSTEPMPSNILSLKKAISIALERDLWIQSSESKQRSMLALSEASLTLPGPRVSLSIANLPSDGFSFNQEPMTQLKAGVSQMLARGDSLKIKSRYQKEIAFEQPLLRANRMAETRVIVSELWLDFFKYEAKIKLVNENKTLLAQLAEIAKANYASGAGSARQQDIIGADIEVNKIDDLLIQLEARKQTTLERLKEWLQLESLPFQNSHYVQNIKLPTTLPTRQELPDPLIQALRQQDRQTLANILTAHPYIKAIEQRYTASTTAIDLAKQKYKPQWGLNASYAYRDNDELGATRADFFSVGISFDVPLYTQQKQDNEVSASVYQAESIKTDKRLVLRQLMSKLLATFALNQRQQQRVELYRSQILPQTIEQAETVLSAFTNNDGTLNEVVNAKIMQLDASLSLLDLTIDLHKSYTQLEYYIPKTIDLEGLENDY
jgi:outer membrane protein TolC